MSDDTFKSKLGIIFVITGSFVGLSNIWSFPYDTINNGGGTFVALYILFAIAIGLPLVISELIIGKAAKKNSALLLFNDIPSKKERPTKFFTLIGVLGIISSFVVASIYSGVASWSFEYLFTGLFKNYSLFTPSYSAHYFNDLTADLSRTIAYQILFCVIAFSIMAFGITRGIEKFSKIAVPIILTLVLVLFFWAFLFGDALTAIKVMVLHRTTNIAGENITFASIAPVALRHMFFSFSLGLAGVITYATYIDKEEPIIDVAIFTVIIDIVVTIFVAYTIFPLYYLVGGEVDSGSSFLFVALPSALQSMSFGKLFGILFFTLVILASLTSFIALMETVVTGLQHIFKGNRLLMILIVGVMVCIVGAMAQPAMSVFVNRALDENIVVFAESIILEFIIPLICLSTALFVGFRLSPSVVEEHFNNKLSATLFTWYVKIIIPVYLFLVLVAPYFIKAKA